jgi:UDP-N-acetylglucosamine:LPS N-acetylglucosamine transferase
MLAWAIKNSQTLARRGAIVELNEEQAEQPERLGRAIGELLADDAKRTQLARSLAEYAHPHAAAELAALVLKIGGEGYVQAKD